MPVEPRDFDQAGLRLRKLAHHAADQKHAVIDHSAENVTAVEPGQDEERRVEQIALDRHSSLADQVMPFESLHGQEYDSAQNRQRHEVAELRLVAALNAA